MQQPSPAAYEQRAVSQEPRYARQGENRAVQQNYDNAYRQAEQHMDSATRSVTSERSSPTKPYPARPKTRNANLLSAVLCLVKELDYTSLEVVEMAVRCRMEELDDWVWMEQPSSLLVCAAGLARAFGSGESYLCLAAAKLEVHIKTAMLPFTLWFKKKRWIVLNFCYFRKSKHRLYYNALVYIIDLCYWWWWCIPRLQNSRFTPFSIQM